MDSWAEVARIAATASVSAGPLAEVPDITTLKFDTQQNIIWCADTDGYTRSLTPSPTPPGANPYQPLAFQLMPYTKFKATPHNEPLLQHMVHKEGILSLLNSNINFNLRRGGAKLSLTRDSFDSTPETAPLFKNLTCMTTNCNTVNDIVVASKLSLMKFDLNKPSHLTSYNHDGNVSLINNLSKFLTLGKSNGSIELFDPLSNESIKTFPGHNGLLSDMDVQGSYIATCGYSVRPRRFNHGANDYLVDPLVNIYDVRMMRPIAPIPFPAGASSVRFHPKLPNIIIVASNTGQLQFVDIYDQTNVYLYQADLTPPPQQPMSHLKSPYLSNLEISENGDFIAFNDSYSMIHMWSLTTNAQRDFVNFPSALEQPDISIPPTIGHIAVDDDIPLTSVGMPYYKDLLLSNWATDLRFTKELAKLPSELDHDLVTESESLQKVGFFPYDKLKYGHRNQNTSYHSLKERRNDNKSVLPKFISERVLTPVGNLSLSKTMSNTSEVYLEDDRKQGALAGLDSDENVFQYKVSPPGSASSIKSKVNLNKIPNCYAQLQIQYSKFGIKDFDFSFYNQTKIYCGLENHTDNSYVNSLLQLYRFQSLFYNIITKNLKSEWLPNTFDTIITKSNPQGSSILNELGYLFDMMHKALNTVVKISNFSQVLSENVDAKRQNLIDITETRSLNSKELRALIVNFNKFFLYQLNRDMYEHFKDDSLFDLMKIEYEVEIRGSGTSCPIYEKQLGYQFSLDLISPPSNVLNKLSILLNPQVHQQTTVPTPTTTRKNHNLLTYLDYSIHKFHTIPCQQHQHQYIHTLEVKTEITKLPGLLTINMNLSNEEFNLITNFKKWLVPEFYAVDSGGRISFKPVLTQFNQDVRKYELLGYVCEISHQSELSVGFHNLVSYIKIDGSWYLFNDFLVMPIPEEEVFNLSYPWKKPVILMYQQEGNTEFEYFNQESFGQIPGLNDEILYRDHFAGTIREGYKKEYELLMKLEAPGIGMHVAIDAEFVTLKPEELEVSYDGIKKLIKPKHLSLARMSALRGDNGPLEGIAFIDDYIVHTTEIQDYLTSFSGIEPGDLDPIKSEKNLVTLQTAYRKLWLLLNLGVVFVGHGLYNDFRCINLQVPAAQIRDTAELYYKSDFKRQLGLKFLAYVLLREKVQTGNHDSIEDAHTALMLYKKYIELKATGEFESSLNFIYSEGQQLRFRVPE